MKNLRKISVLLITFLIVVSNLKVYANSTNEEWKFIVQAKDTYSATDTLENLTLAETCDDKTLINGTIAPGTSGSFTITVETDDLGAEYNIVFDNFSSDFPKNFIFMVDDEPYDIKTGFYNKMNGEGKATHTVNWFWDYDAEDEYVERESSEISFRISVKAAQVNERIIPEQITRNILPKTGF